MPDSLSPALDLALRQIRLALGSGICYGLDVRSEGNALLIEPGLAFDAAGAAIALDEPLRVPPPDSMAPRWLAVRDAAGSLEIVWLGGPPSDDIAVPLARVVRGPAGWQVDRSVARRIPPLAHRHTGETMADARGYLRYDGTPLRAGGGTTSAGEDLHPLLTRLEAAVAAEFAKLDAHQQAAEERASLLALELEELRTEVAEAAERAASHTPADAADGWQEAIAALRDELMITAGEDLRAELDQLRADHLALAQRPTLPIPDMGSYTPIGALHGIGSSFAQKLHELSVESVSDFLAAAADPTQRARVEELGLGAARLRRWAREADLLRLHGAGPTEVALLGDAGIEGSATLAIADAALLYEQLIEAANARTVAPPSYAWVLSWIEQARLMPPVVGW